MLKWKKNANGEVDTAAHTDFTDVDLTWIGSLASVEEAIQVAEQLQAQPAAAQSAAADSSAPASSATVNLTTSGSFGIVGPAFFLASTSQPAGTGVFNTFVQIQNDGTEQGYNTDARPQQFDERNSAQHNHSLLLSNVAIFIGDGTGGTNEGTVYREFRLDLNEPNGGDKKFLSLDDLQIFQESAGNRTGFTPDIGFGAPGEHLVYNLDAGGDNWVALNAGLSSGSGESDVRVLIPDALFDPSLPYVVVYSAFGYQGSGWTSDGGFEEWATNVSQAPGGGGAFALNVTKTAVVPGDTADTAGETISYTIRLQNTGAANLTGITVTDPFVSNLTRGLDAVGNNDAVLNVGEIWSYSANHTVTQDEIDNSNVINNTVTADSDQTGPDTASSSISIDRNPQITLTKNAMIVGGAVDAAGDVIHYRLTATNDGNVTLTNPVVTDPQFTSSTPINGAQVKNPNVQVFTPVTDGDYNLGDTDNDGIEETTDHNGVRDPGETFQYVYRGDIDQNGRHDPGETWVAFNLGDTNNNGVRNSGETFVGDANNNGIEDNGEQWQFKNLGDTNNNNLQDPGETWQYANIGDNDQDGVEDPGETFEYRNVGDTNQNGSEDPGETFQYYNAGDTNQNGIEDNGETFQYLVSNTVTSVDTNNDGRNDGDTNLDGNLSVGETWKYTATYTATQDDIDNRNSNGIPTFNLALTHNNTATVTTDVVADSASTSVPIAQNPELAISKAVSSITSTDEAEGTTAVDEAGDIINYTVLVDNTGNMTLTGVSVDDPSADLTYVSGDANNDGELDLLEVWTYTGSHEVTQAEIDNGGTFDAGLTLGNTASATSTQTVAQGDAAATDSASVPIEQNPQLAINKAVSSITSTDEAVGTTTADAAGDIINYTVTVNNTGNMTLTALMVADPLVDFAYDSGDIDNDGKLDRAETWTYVGSYVVQQADIDNNGGGDGDIDNTASVTSSQTVAQGDLPATDSEFVTVVQNPAVTLEKSGEWEDSEGGNGYADAGEQVHYTFEVRNDGNVTLNAVEVTDTLVGGPLGGPDSGDTINPGMLDVGETWIYLADYTLTSGDVVAGTVHNDATASALGPQGQAASDDDSADVTLPQPPAPLMTLDKSDAVGTIFVDSNENGVADTGDGTTSGDLVEFVIQLTNDSDVALSNVVVDDPLVGGVLGGPDGGDANNILDVGETWTWVRNYFITEDDVTEGSVFNEATATALDPLSQLVSATAQWDVVFPTL